MCSLQEYTGPCGENIIKPLSITLLANAGDTGSIPESGYIPQRRKWQPTPGFLSGYSHGQRSQVGYSLWDHEESDTTEHICTQTRYISILGWRSWWLSVSPAAAFQNFIPSSNPPIPMRAPVPVIKPFIIKTTCSASFPDQETRLIHMKAPLICLLSWRIISLGIK